MDPEILLEQIVSYTIGASEMIPDISRKADHTYQLALLPYGPHFYTGILQSAGYLLLPEKIKTLFIMPQDHKADEIFQITGKIGPIFGRERTLHQDKNIGKTFDIFGHSLNKSSDILMNKSSDILIQHLAFLTTIQAKTTEISCLAIGEKIPPATQKKLTAYLMDCLPDTNIVFLQNFTSQQGTKGISEKTFIPAHTKQSTIKSFYAISSKLKKKPEIIAYAHGSKTGGQGYACILA